MAKREHKYEVGIFVIITVGILLASIMWVTGARLFGNTLHYRMYFTRPVTGLFTGATVDMAGVPVGKVTSVTLVASSPPKVEVDISIHPGTPVRRDSIATLRESLISDTRTVQILGGTQAAGPLPNGGVLAVHESSFRDLREDLVHLTGESNQLVTYLGQTILNQQNQAELRQMFDDLSVSARNLRVISTNLADPRRLGTIDAAIDNMDRASRRLNLTAEKAARTVDSIRDNVGQVSASVISVANNANHTLAHADRVTSSLNTVVDRNAVPLEQVLANLIQTEANINELITTISANPSVLVWGVRTPKREAAQ
jgi:phospholipid/cholesterol/gamma-HCH transport system substrate-binding protein